MMQTIHMAEMVIALADSVTLIEEIFGPADELPPAHPAREFVQRVRMILSEPVYVPEGYIHRPEPVRHLTAYFSDEADNARGE
jgi:hypothetical protein